MMAYSCATIVCSIILLSEIFLASGLYLGCWKEDKRKRNFGNAPGSIPRGQTTVPLCKSECASWGYQYAGITQGDFCFCSNTAPDVAPLMTVDADGFCSDACAGDSAPLCGGFDHVSVYKTPLLVEGLYLQAAGTTGLKIAKAGELTEFSVSVTAAPTDVRYKLDYGPGQTDAVGANDTETFGYNFTAPGEQVVSVYASDSAWFLPEERASTVVLVQAEAEDVEVNCPPVVVVGTEFRCNASIRVGNRMRAYIDYDDGETDEFPIPDASWDTSGAAVPQHGYHPPVPTDNTVYFSVDRFREDGELDGVELFVNETENGNLYILLLSPSCGGAYCEETNQCGACATDTCSVSDVYCSATRECVPENAMSTGTCVHPDAMPTAAVAQYVVKARILVSVTTTGWQYHDLSAAGYSVAAGDVIGVFVETAGVLVGTRTKTGAEDGDGMLLNSPSGGVVGETMPPTDESYRILVRGHATKRTWLRLFKTFNVPGDFDVSVTVVNDFITGSASNTTLVSAQIGINVTEIICPPYGATAEAFTCTLAPHTGANVTYDWNFTSIETGTVTLRSIQYIPSVTVTLGDTGNYTVSCRAFNLLDDKTNDTTFILQDTVTGLNVTADVARVHDNHPFTIELATGSDYTCDWSMGDGTTFSTTDIETPIPSSVQTHNYTVEQDNSVTINCSNMVSFDFDSLTVTSLFAIINLRFDKTGALTTDPTFSITWLEDEGTVLLADWVFTSVEFVDDWGVMTTPGSGMYLVSLTGSNPVSTETITMNFTVDAPITNPVVSMSPIKAEHLRMDIVTITVDMDTGSSVIIEYDWDDGSAVDTYEVGLLVDWDGNPYVKAHTQQVPGDLNVTVTVKNNFQSIPFNFLYKVLARIENITLVSDAPIAFIDGEAVINFQIPSSTQPAPVGAVVSLNYGDGTDPVVGLTYGEATKYTHTYTSAGTYSVVANVSNSISYTLLYLDVTAVVPVANLRMFVDPPHAPIGQPVTVGVYMDKGNDVTIYWNCDWSGIGDEDFEDVKKRPGDSTPYDINNSTCIYNGVTNYTLVVTASNPLGNTTLFYTIQAQHAVTDDFVLSSASPATYPPGLTNLLLDFNTSAGATPPTDAFVTIEWMDGQVLGPIPYDHLTPYNWSHIYAQDGNYEAKITISNLATSITYTMTTGVYEDISGFVITPMYQPEIPYNGAHQPGLGPSANIFPAHLAVQLHATTATGTVVLFMIEAVHKEGDAIQLCEQSESPAVVNFLVEGEYDINVTASSPLYSDTYTLTIEVRRSVTGMQINDYGVTKPKEFKTFTIWFEDVGRDACLLVDWGDGQADSRQLYSNGTDCMAAHGFSQIHGAISNPMNITRYLKKTGSFELLVDGYSYMGNDSKIYPYVVSTSDCTSPVVSIDEIKDDFFDPRVVSKSESFSILSRTVLECAVSLENSKQWEVEQIDPHTGATISTIDISALDTHQNSELSIPARFLEFGTYRFTVTVTMASKQLKENFASSVSSCARIEPSPLIGLLTSGGMSMITAGWQVSVLLEPGQYSRDPDLPDDAAQNFASFTWFCRQIDETFPLTADGKLSTANPSTPKTAANVGSFPDNGGCFRDGPGVVSVPGTGETFTFDTVNMHENETYEFIVVINKDTRETNATILIDILPGNPPSIAIDCKDKLCKASDGGLRINPTNRMALKATCTSNCGDDLIYTWTMFRAGLNGAWLEIEDFSQYIEAENSGEIAVSKQLFEDGWALWSQLYTYRIKLSAARPGGTAGVAYTVLTLNDAPTGGNCTIWPPEGFTISTKWTGSCWDWSDSDGISQYLFYASFKDDDVEKHLSYGQEATTELDLPMGPAYNNYDMNVYCRISDSFGSTTEYFMGVVRAKPLEKSDVAALMPGVLDEIDTAAAEGDLKHSATVFTKGASLLNNERNDDMAEYVSVGTSAMDTATGYGPGAAHLANQNYTDTYTGDQTPAEREAEYQAERNSRSLTREKMGLALAQMTKVTMPAIQLSASIMSVIAANPEEITLLNQESLSSSLAEMSHQIYNLKDETPIEELEATIGDLLATAGQVLEAGMRNINDTTITDQFRSMDTEFWKYDTDWESSRQNFDDLGRGGLGDLRGETSEIVQVHADPQIVTDIRDTVDTCGKVLMDRMVEGEPEKSIITPKLTLSVAKDKARNILNRRKLQGRSTVQFPQLCSMRPNVLNCSDDDVIGYMSSTTPMNQYKHLPTKKVNEYSECITSDLFDKDGNPISIKDSPVPIILAIPRDERRIVVPEATMIEARIPKREEDTLFFHSANVTTPECSLHIEMEPVDKNVQFLVFLRYLEVPIYNATMKKWDYMFTLPNTTNALEWDSHTFTIFLDNDEVNNRLGKWYVGLRQLNETEEDQYGDGVTLPNPVPLTGQFTTNYTLRIYTSGCYFYDDATNDWSSRGCKVQKETTHLKTVCSCNHMTTFGSGWAVEPNKIDFSYVFSNADFFTNMTLYITEILIAVVYIGFAIWARRQDKKDKLKLGVTPLPDNEAQDTYLYEVVVHTGLRKNAGTDSTVRFIVSGDEDETDVRTFGDTQRKIFRRGAQDSFLLATPRPLGALNYMRVWHDNAGKGKFQGWYLNHIMIHDIQTKERWIFIGNDWFAVEESDGMIDRLLPVAGPEQMTETSHLFGQKATRNMSDDHLWFSVIARPPESRFTRLQRVSCCLCLLFSSMLANAMFYERTPDGTTQGSLEFGPFSLTPEQIYVGVIANLIVFPINFVLVFMFRKSKPRKLRKSRIQEALDRYKSETQSRMSESDTDPIIAESYGSYTSPLQPDAHNINTGRPMSAVDIDPENNPKKKPKKKFTFPWWCVVVAWMLLWAVTLTCAAFVTFYGIQFGDSKARKWITSMIISFFTSIFLTQPIKVFLLALVFSMIFKKTDDDDDGLNDEEEPTLQHDETWAHAPPNPLRQRNLTYTPPDRELLEKARHNRLQELKMYDVLREVLFYAFFLWILLIVSYGFRDPNAFLMKSEMYNTLVHGGSKKISNATNDLSKVRDMQQYFDWARDTLIPGIRADNWYNGQPPIGQRGFIGDRNSRIMGWAVMRQLRVKKGNCETVPRMVSVVPECNTAYDIWSEDKTPYMGPYWTHLTPDVNGTYNETIKEHFTYRDADSLSGWPFWAKHGLYSGGGYVVELRGDAESLENKITELESDGWLDRYTRAVFVEFTTYNAQVNLFGITTLVAEFLKSGGINLYGRVEPVNLLGYASSARLFQIACQIIYACFIIFFLVKEIRKAVKGGAKEYLQEPWNYVELFIIGLSIGGVAIYFYRWYETNGLTTLFKETHGNAYIKFQYVGYWNELLLYMLGWLVFFATVKFIRLLRFNKRMSLLGQTLRVAARALLMFGIMFGIVFMAYCQFFYHIYFMDLYNFSTIVYTMETCLQMLVGKFNFTDMQFASPILGPATFFCYVVTVYYILINMFLTILNESFATVRADIDKQSNEHELVEFMIKRFKQWTGLGALLGAGKDKSADKEKDKEANEQQIDKFQNKIEQLLESLSKAYHNQDEFESLFYSNNGGKGADGKMMKKGDGTGKDYLQSGSKSGMRNLRQRPDSRSNSRSNSAGYDEQRITSVD